MHTDICDRLGIDVPIFGFSHCRDVVAEVTKAGGLGVLGAASFTPEELEIELRWLDDELGGRRYGVDVLMAESHFEGTYEEMEAQVPQEHRDFVAQLEDELGIPPLSPGATIVAGSVFHNPRQMALGGTHASARRHIEVIFDHHKSISLLAFGLGRGPKDVVDKAHKLGLLVGGVVGTARHAQKQVEGSADLLIASGTEGAGHNGEIGSMVLIPEIVDAAGDVPVLASGGIADGRQIAAAQSLGAAGVWTGTIWLTTSESDVEEEIKDLMLKAGSRDTIRTRSWSGNGCRFLTNPLLEAWDRPGAPTPLKTPLQRVLMAPTYERIVAAKMYELMSFPVGQCIGEVGSRKRVRDVMHELQEQYITAISKLAALNSDLIPSVSGQN